MSRIDEMIRDEMRDVAAGDKKRVHCPFCGATNEASLGLSRSATRSHIIGFKCWRGTCAANGYVIDRAGAGVVLNADDSVPAAKPLREYGRPPEAFLNLLAVEYKIPLQYFWGQGVRFASYGDTLCMPWLNADQTQIGWCEKRFAYGGDIYKSHHDLADRNPNNGRLAYPRIGRSYHALKASTVGVLVEGLLDAYRVNSYMAAAGADVTAIALLGAQISIGDATRLSGLYKHLLVVLDPDQWPKGHQRVMRSFGATAVHVQATVLPHDPKDSSDEDLESLLARCREMLCVRT